MISTYIHVSSALFTLRGGYYCWWVLAQNGTIPPIQTVC